MIGKFIIFENFWYEGTISQNKQFFLDFQFSDSKMSSLADLRSLKYIDDEKWHTTTESRDVDGYRLFMKRAHTLLSVNGYPIRFYCSSLNVPVCIFCEAANRSKSLSEVLHVIFTFDRWSTNYGEFRGIYGKPYPTHNDICKWNLTVCFTCENWDNDINVWGEDISAISVKPAKK